MKRRKATYSARIVETGHVVYERRHVEVTRDREHEK